jgi:hypothetical protein
MKVFTFAKTLHMYILFERNECNLESPCTLINAFF